MWNPDVGPPPENLATAMRESKTLLRTSVSSWRKAAKQQVATLRPTTSQISRTATTIATTWPTCVHARGGAKPKQAPCPNRQADAPTPPSKKSGVMQSRSGDQEQLKQSSEQQLVPRAFQNPRDTELMEMSKRAVVTKSRSHLVPSSPSLPYASKIRDRTAVTFRFRPLELARSRSDPWLRRTNSATFCMRAAHGDVHPELLRDVQGTKRQRP